MIRFSCPRHHRDGPVRSSVALAERAGCHLQVKPGASVTFVTTPMSSADRLDCESFSRQGHFLQTPCRREHQVRATGRLSRGQRKPSADAGRGPFTYSLPVRQLDPGMPDGAIERHRPLMARVGRLPFPTKRRSAKSSSHEHDRRRAGSYFNNIHGGFQLSSRGAGCTLTKPSRSRVAPRAHYQDTAALQSVRCRSQLLARAITSRPRTGRCTRSVGQVVHHKSARRAQQHQYHVLVRLPRGECPDRQSARRPMRRGGRGTAALVSGSDTGQRPNYERCWRSS